jgi:predicted metal-dependent hydrolase
MQRLTLFAITILLFLLAPLTPLAAQGGPWVRQTDPDKIEAAYRSKAPYNQIEFIRVDRPPFLFFIQTHKKGQTAKDLSYLADSRFAALTAIVKLFAKDFAEPLKLKLRPRPMPYWILRDRETYTEKMKGSKFSGAYYSLTDMHTMTYEDRGRSTHETFATSMHEATHQIMFQYTDPKRSLQQNVLSGWLMEGMAEHLSSRPHGPMLKDRDPGFGFLDIKKINQCRSSLNRPFTWKRKGSINFFHNPMQVMHYQSLQQYLRATGVNITPKTDTERTDYGSQMGIFYRAAYSITAFLDRGYKGFYKSKLLKVMSYEYGCPDAEGNMMASIHGIRAIRKSFTPEELAALPNRFADFVRNPKRIVESEMPEGAAEAVASSGTGAAGGLFPEPGASKISLPTMKEADEEIPILVDLGRALGLFKQFRLAEAKELIEDIEDPVAEKLSKNIEGLQSLLDAFLAKAEAKPGRTKIKISIAGAKAQTWAILDYRNTEGMLTVKRSGEETTVMLGDLRPSYFAEAAMRYKLVKTDEQKTALGLGIALELESLQDSKREKSIRKLATKKFIPLEHSWLKELEGVVQMTAAFEKAATDVRLSRQGEKILESLSSSLGNMKKGDDRDWLVRHYVPAMLDSVFLKSAGWSQGLKGKVKSLAGSKVRIDYDWSNPSQSGDWIFVDPIKGGFSLPEQYYGKLRKDERPHELKIDSKKKRFQIFGNGFVRHKLQFEGDVKITFEWALGMTDTAEGRQLRISALLVLMNALRPNSFVSAEIGIAGGGGLKVIERGRRRSTANYKRDSFTKLVQGAVEGKSLTFERKGAEAYLKMGGETILTIKRADKVPNMGALGFLSMGAALSDKNRGPTVEIGKVSIEGKPHDASLKAAKALFLNRWVRRFPGLN